jgi:O-acetyl-ADP-ribose deacetylase (regulator of RNase III)
MIEIAQGNLLHDDAEALVNTVNCVGVMGKGIALQFKQAYPEMNMTYERACELGEVQPGRMLVWKTGQLTGPQYVINFPTKRHWIGRSKYEDIESGLTALVAEVKQRGIQSIAIPPLGCGNGGLKWAKIRPMIEAAFASIPDVQVHLYAPIGPPESADRVIATKRPRMTRSRAMFLLAMERYAVLAYETTQLEIQKLAYFLQEAGESLRLNYVAQHYGPYAENLNKVLEDMEGHLISGFDGSRSPEKIIELREGANVEAAAFLKEDADAQLRMKRLGSLIEGFETPYGMELLASVHWVATHTEPPARTTNQAVTAIRQWNRRKAEGFSAEHIVKAWEHLAAQGWIGSPDVAE